MKYLIVVDMQVDFVSGSLGTNEAQRIVGGIAGRIRAFDGRVLFTRDTHEADYLSTQEGRSLPIPHCIRNTDGWQIVPELRDLAREVVDKPTFGSTALGALLAEENEKAPIDSIELIGLCTDICVLSNALLLKSCLPETPISVDAACCAGATPQGHDNALAAMRVCQIAVENAGREPWRA